MKYIIELQRDGEGFTLKETLGQLGIPDKFVGIHRRIAITTATLHIQIGGKSRAPRSCKANHTAIGELPGIKVIVCLKLATAMLIVKRTIEFNLQPVVTIAGGQTLHNSGGCGNRLLGVAIHIGTNVTYVMDIRKVGESVDIKVASRVDGGIKHKAEVSIPVTIDVLRTSDAATCLWIQGCLIANRIAGGREIYERHHGALVFLEIVVIEQTEILRERWLKSRITLRDVQRVAIISDIKQVAHRGLAGVSTISKAKLTRLRLLPTEIHRRSEVSYGAGGVRMNALIILSEM